MAKSAAKIVTYTKLNAEGEPLQRVAYTPAEHLNLKMTGWAPVGSSEAKAMAENASESGGNDSDAASDTNPGPDRPGRPKASNTRSS